VDSYAAADDAEDVFNRIAVALERIATAIEPTAREVSVEV
jgi:hypothetical protein